MFTDIFAIISVAAPYVLTAEATIPGDNQGRAKEAQVVAAIDADINAPGGLEYPSWMPVAVRPIVLSAIIKLVVFLFNRAGGPDLVKKWLGSSMPQSKAGSPASSSPSAKS